MLIVSSSYTFFRIAEIRKMRRLVQGSNSIVNPIGNRTAWNLIESSLIDTIEALAFRIPDSPFQRSALCSFSNKIR